MGIMDFFTNLFAQEPPAPGIVVSTTDSIVYEVRFQGTLIASITRALLNEECLVTLMFTDPVSRINGYGVEHCVEMVSELWNQHQNQDENG